MKKKPLVSVIITTRNEEKNIKTCLESIKAQLYQNLEIIVVDNNSTDKTKNISKSFTKKIFNKGPERSVQRNYGVKKSNGEYVLILDADMKLSKRVVSDCVNIIQKENVGGVIIPEESYGIGFWAQVKKLERSFYVGNDLIEAARFFPKNMFNDVGGFDESITGPEDWDLSQRVKDKYGLTRIHSFIYHNEGKLTFWKTVGKKYYYAKKVNQYTKKSINKDVSKTQFSLINRYKTFLQKPGKLFRDPVLGLGVLILKTAEFIAGGLGFLNSKYVKS